MSRPILTAATPACPPAQASTGRVTAHGPLGSLPKKQSRTPGVPGGGTGPAPLPLAAEESQLCGSHTEESVLNRREGREDFSVHISDDIPSA